MLDFINGETVSFVLFFTGMYGLISQRNIVKSIISLSIMQTAVILFFVTINFEQGSIPPILNGDKGEILADPLPQALMITSIVIGVGVTAAALIMFIHMHHKYGTVSWINAMRRRWLE